MDARTVLSNPGKWVYLFPALLAIYPPLFFYGYNIHQAYLYDLGISVSLSLTGTFILWAIFRCFLKDSLQAGLAVTFGLVLFFGYGHLIEFLEDREIIFPLHRHFQILAALLFLWGYFIGSVRRKAGFWLGTAKFLTILACLLMVVNLSVIARYHWREWTRGPDFDQASLRLPPGKVPSGADRLEAKQRPDIYLIVLDEYASSATIRDILSFDNSPFENSLRRLGFRIAGNSTTHTGNTATVIASLLNMRQLENPEYGEEGPIFAQIRNNLVFAALHSLGYLTIHFPILHYASMVSPITGADVNVDPNRLGTRRLGDFQYELIQTTLFRPLLKKLYDEDAHSLSAIYTNYIFNQLQILPRQHGPKFVYAHVPCPHTPFVFDEAGRFIGYRLFRSEQYYLGQYKYVSRKVLTSVETILQESADPPVIILLSDHGPRGKIANTIGSKDEHWQKTFYAILLPDNNLRDRITDSFSMFETFPLLFRHYFPEVGTSQAGQL